MHKEAGLNSGEAENTEQIDAGIPADELLPLVYAELRALASSRMRSLAGGQTLQPTALVHEAYARLVDRKKNTWQNVGHFFYSAARAMHDILVEDARRKSSLKRGGTHRRLPLESVPIPGDMGPDDLIALSEAIETLKHKSDRQYQLVMLRYFAGLTLEEAASAMGVSERTLRRDWQYIRARLHSELTGNDMEHRGSNA